MRVARMVIREFMPDGDSSEFEIAATIRDDFQKQLDKILTKRLVDDVWECAYEFAEASFSLWKVEYGLIKTVQAFIDDLLDRKRLEATSQNQPLAALSQALGKKEVPRDEALAKIRTLHDLQEKQGTGFSSAHHIDVKSLRVWRGRCRMALGALARVADTRFPLPLPGRRTDIPFSAMKPEVRLGLVEATGEIEVRSRLFADNTEDALVEQVEKDKLTKARRKELRKWAKQQGLQPMSVSEVSEDQPEKVEFDGVKTKAEVAVHEEITIPLAVEPFEPVNAP